MVLQSKDKKDVMPLSMTDNEKMVDIEDNIKNLIKLPAVTEYKNTTEEQILLISPYQVVLLTRE
jgi:hypothetical protein